MNCPTLWYNMKLFPTFVVFITLVVLTSALDDISKILSYQDGDRYFVAQYEDKIKLIDLEVSDTNTRFNVESDTLFRLYTRKQPNNPQIITYNNIGSLTNSDYDKSKATKIIIHGHSDNGFAQACIQNKNKFLEVFDVNVICVDWGVGASALYPTSVGYVPLVGVFVGKFVDWLVDQDSPISRFHLLGHSLGAHIVGNAGRSVARGKVPYITGWDPAFPLWGASSQRIRPTDGEYVEIIHTNSGSYGLEAPVGHNDFYPNGGKTMTGCSSLDFNCSHSKSYEYFAYSIGNTKFMAQQCSSLDEVLNDRCSNLSQLHMGGANAKPARGLFLLTTTANPPFYL